MDRILKSRYKIQEKISDSPSHVTYKGAMVDSDKSLVIKIYRRQYLDSVLIKQLKKEVALLSRLDSPFIPRLIDGDYGWQGFYFVREYVDGSSLRETKLPLEADQAAETAASICDAVGAAHKAGIVHGSLTPENIFLARTNNRIKVADFGIKKAVSEPVEQRAKWLMDPSSSFTAPEVLLGDNSSARSDIYQIGLLLIFMLSPESNTAKKGIEYAAETLLGGKQAYPVLNGKLPKYLEDVIRRCIERDPLMRFASVPEIAAALRSKSVPDKRSGFMDMLETDYASAEEPEIKKEEPENLPEETIKPGIGIFRDDTPVEKGDKIDLIKWVFFSVWVAIAAGIAYSLINILLLGE
jgi:eukaryotic-like serine/threonine-protein kinase